MENIQRVTSSIFKRKQEFPNYFKEDLDVNNLDDCLERINLISACIDHIINRLTIPYIVEDEIKKQGFFSHLINHINIKLPELKTNFAIYIGGGVIRSLIGYLYKHIYYKKLTHNLSTALILSNLLAKTEKIFNHTLILGVGSDFDVYYKVDNPEVEPLFVEVLYNYINAAESKLALLNYNNPIKKSFLSIADVKPYLEQIETVISQGGSQSDWLAFEISNLTKDNKFILPKGYDHILFDLLLKGEYGYMAAKEGIIAPQKQAIRGCRALVELPFVKVKDTNCLIKDLENIQEVAQLEEASLEQVDKLIRNSNLGGANNRIYRSKPNSPLFQLARLSKEHYEKEEVKEYLIPHFLPGTTKKLAINNLDLEQYLIPMQLFFDNFTEQGVIYHGTGIDGFLSIIRSGFWISDQEIGQGISSFGPGVYATNIHGTAESYAKDNPVCIIPITLNTKYPTRVLNWQELDKILQNNLTMQAKELGYGHVFYLLRKEYNIDIIINEHLIIQNLHVIKTPKYPEKFIDAKIVALQKKIETTDTIGDKLSIIINQILPLCDLATVVQHDSKFNSKTILDKYQDLFIINEDFCCLDFYEESEVSYKVWDKYYDNISPFIKAAASLNIKHNNIKKAFILAVKYGFANVWTNMLQQGIDINTQDRFGNSLAHWMANHRNTNADTIKLLQKQGLNFATRNQRGETALHNAIRKGNFQVIEELINTGIDLNQKDHQGRTYAHLISHSSEGIELLLKYGADFNIQDKEGNTPLLENISKYSDTKRIFKLLEHTDCNLINNKGLNAAYLAVKEGHIEIVKQLLNRTDFNIRDEDGYLSICWATAKGYMDVVKLLIKQEMDLSWQYQCSSDNFIDVREEFSKVLQNLAFGIGYDVDAFPWWTESFRSFCKKYGDEAEERLNKILTYKMEENITAKPICILLQDIAFIMGHTEIVQLFKKCLDDYSIPDSINDNKIYFAYQNYAKDYVENSVDSDDPFSFFMKNFSKDTSSLSETDNIIVDDENEEDIDSLLSSYAEYESNEEEQLESKCREYSRISFF